MSASKEIDDWQIAGIRKAIESLDRGNGISHVRIKEWVESWGSSRELPKPARLNT
jgi:predicted transcriptional regulator